MKENVLRKKWEKCLRAGIRLLMATGVCFTVVACYAPYFGPEPPDGWYEPNPAIPRKWIQRTICVHSAQRRKPK